jgi:hypothetical protein
MLNIEQTNILLRGINGKRIEHRKQAGMNLSYLSQHDVRAHLIRVFGFCGFDLTTLTAQLAFEHEVNSKWEVGYQVTMQLAIKDSDGRIVAVYSETAVGSSTQGRRSEAHDMAMKTASSDAMKRCAINLGDQFGLSLYDNGSTSPIVKATLVGPHLTAAAQDAPTAPVEAPVSDERPDNGSQDGSAPIEVVAAFSLAAEMTANGDRILEVAALKTQHAEHLDDVVEIDGQTMTIGRYADLIAAGAYTQKEQ